MSQKVALVTGGARNIGFEIAKKLLQSGISVHICSRNQQEVDVAIAALQKEILPHDLASKAASASGVTVSGSVCDVSSQKHCVNLISQVIKQYGHIDILVNNAGIYGPIGQLQANDVLLWEKAIEVNLFGTMYCTKAVLPYFQKQKSGKIINLAGAGVGGVKPLPRFSAYYVSKTAVVAFTEVIAAENLEHNIQINCISPGAVNSFFTDYLIEQGEAAAGRDMYALALKTKESGGDSPTLAADTVAYLASEKANGITGRMISAKWDKIEQVDFKTLDENIFKLRRIDEVFFTKTIAKKS